MSSALKDAEKRRHRVRLGRAAENICPTTGKRKFPTAVLAQQELVCCQTRRRHQGRSHVERNHYYCVQCAQFHLTSQEKGHK